MSVTSKPAEIAPLRFWFGPFCLATAKLRVRRISYEVNVDAAEPSPPDLSQLTEDLVGYFRQSEPCSSAVTSISTDGHILRYVARRYEHSFIDLSGGFDGYLGHFSAKTRSTLRRKVRKFTEASGGMIDWRQYRAPEEMEEFHRHARAISRLSYQEKLFDAGIPKTDEFLNRMRGLAAHDRVRAYLLFYQGAPVSYLYCPVAGGRLIYAYLGFVPEFAKLSPGTVLHYLALEQLFSEGKFRIFDFTDGEGEHKSLFSTHQVPCADVFYLRRSLWTTGLVRAHRMFFNFASGAESLLDRVGLKRRLRKMLRGTAVG